MAVLAALVMEEPKPFALHTRVSEVRLWPLPTNGVTCPPAKYLSLNKEKLCQFQSEATISACCWLWLLSQRLKHSSIETSSRPPISLDTKEK